MDFWLGTHEEAWLANAGVPLMVSRARLSRRKNVYPRAIAPWVLDSGGFTELSLRSKWTIDARTYVAEVKRYRDEVGMLDWAAPQDWMCEPFITAKTGLSVAEHQARTVGNFIDLRAELGPLVIPVLQGYTLDDYLHCIKLFDEAGVDLAAERVVGVGSVCRRQDTAEIGEVLGTVRSIVGDRLHGFGVKMLGVRRYGVELASSDSLAWSYNARKNPPMAGCSHRSCANCKRWALRWRERLISVAPR